ncbi:GerAB/ArcD/ProY family transporter [Roseburia sp. 499]|uniref:GerAB/ArcD/ProY family transporter n=1 Tax=Roseburia sp. 499 TaxID=1261634 RepID=UPI000952C83A|nr:GerAB/ArcD/ProY family transporter [Roseburia sp. 499]WVK70627.1 GerAB/ArcD/ProY family transporter [Roseburia sp. 499]
MFADNWKISLRQISRLIILDLFGLSSLVLPGILADMTGADGIFCLLLGMCGGLLMLGLIQGNLKFMQESYYEYMKENIGQFLADIFMVFYLMYFIVLAGYVVYQMDVLILSWLLPEGAYWMVELWVLLLAGYGTFRGIEGRARIYEILFWFLGIPLIIMLGFAATSVNTDYWTPIFYSDGKLYMENSFTVWSFLLPLAGILFLKPFAGKTEKLAVCGKRAVITVTLVNVVIYLILIGNFGQNTVQILKRPIITLMSMINLPGGFFPRQDVTMTAVWFFALFALLHTGVFQGTLILKELCHETKTNYSMVAVLVLIFFTGNSFMKNHFMENIFESYQRWIALPGMFGILLLVPIICHVRTYFKKRKGGRKRCENV